MRNIITNSVEDAKMKRAQISPERWREIKPLLESALELKADDRPAFLDRSCASDEALRREVESFISAHEQAGDFMDKPAFEEAARMLVEERSARKTLAMDRVATDERSYEGGSPPPAFRPPQVAPALRQAKARAPLWAPLIVVLIALLATAVVGAIAWLRMGAIDWSRLSPWSDRTSPTPDAKPPADPERGLSYSLLALRNPKANPGSRPFPSHGAIIFKEGDQVRLNVSSPQAGYLYIINEGPELTGSPPDFVVMFPNAAGDAQIEADQTIQIPAPSGNPEADWFVFDEVVGVEKIWLIWSEHSVAEMETVKRWANPKDKGLIGDPNQVRAVAQYLKALAATEVEVEKDEASQRAKLKGRGEVLAGVVRLEHR
jgi:uncharacterized protein DUF4384